MARAAPRPARSREDGERDFEAVRLVGHDDGTVAGASREVLVGSLGLEIGGRLAANFREITPVTTSLLRGFTPTLQVQLVTATCVPVIVVISSLPGVLRPSPDYFFVAAVTIAAYFAGSALNFARHIAQQICTSTSPTL